MNPDAPGRLARIRLEPPMTPTKTPLALLAALTLMALSLSGCVGQDSGDGSSAGQDDASGPNVDLAPQDEAAAPVWQVGQWFGHHVFFGADDSEGEHFNSVVVEASGGTSFLAADDQDVAIGHAFLDFPILGPVDADISTTGLGMDWEFYQWPLVDNKTWTRTVAFPDDPELWSTMAGLSPEVTYRATYAPEIPTASGGVFPGFEIEATLDDGTPVYTYDYVPAIGWYAHYWLWDFTTEDPGDFVFHSMSMGHGLNWTGTYYIDTIETLAEVLNHVVPPVNEDGSPNTAFLMANPHTSFTMSEQATYLAGFTFSYAMAGAHDTRLIDPNNEVHEWTATSTDNPATGGEGSFVGPDDFLKLDAVPGEWQATMVGAGFVAVGGVFVYEIVETAGTL